MKNKILTDDAAETTVDLNRRRALARLGLGLSAAYAVPALLTLSRGAHASSGEGGDPDGGDPDGGESSGGENSGGGSASGGSAGVSGGSDGVSDSSDGSEDLTADGSGPSDEDSDHP